MAKGNQLSRRKALSLANIPDTGEKVTRRQGRFGPYLQLGEVPEGSKEKPKRASIPRAFDPNDIDLETALKFLALPREIGLHPGNADADRCQFRALRAVHSA